VVSGGSCRPRSSLAPVERDIGGLLPIGLGYPPGVFLAVGEGQPFKSLLCLCVAPPARQPMTRVLAAALPLAGRGDANARSRVRTDDRTPTGCRSGESSAIRWNLGCQPRHNECWSDSQGSPPSGAGNGARTACGADRVNGVFCHRGPIGQIRPGRSAGHGHGTTVRRFSVQHAGRRQHLCRCGALVGSALQTSRFAGGQGRQSAE
jgi:hypothetical protein